MADNRQGLDINTILSAMQAQQHDIPASDVQQPASATPELNVSQSAPVPPAVTTIGKKPTRGTMIQGVDYNGKDVAVYSVGRKPHTEQEFAAALDAYNNSKGRPQPGFNVIDISGLIPLASLGRQNQQINEQTQRNQQPTLPFFSTKPLTSTDVQNPILRSAVDTVRNPITLGATLGTLVAAPWLGPTVGAARPFLTGLGNAAKVGFAAMSGAEGMQAITGEGINPLQSPGAALKRAGTEFALYGTAQGAVGVLSHWIGKYLDARTGEKVATDILNEVKKQFPNLANDPTLLPAYLSSKEGLRVTTQLMSKGLLGDIENRATSIITDLNSALPGNLSKGTQNTIRAQVRSLLSASNDYLDASLKGKSIDVAQEAISKAQDAIYNVIRSEFTGQKTLPAALLKVQSILADNSTASTQYQEAASMLGAFRRADMHEGFDFVKLANAIKGTYKEQPGSIVDRIGTALAGGSGRLLSVPAQAVQQQPDFAEQMVRDGLIKMFPSLKYLLGTSKAVPVQSMPWQTGVSSAKGQGLASAGIAVSIPTVKKYIEESK